MAMNSAGPDRPSRSAWPLIALGLALPFVIVALIPVYHKGDLMAYARWADCLEAFGSRIYLECLAYRPESPLHYPSVGLWLSGGVVQAMRLLSESLLGRTLDALATDALVRFYLAIFASLDFLLLAWLARLMRYGRPLLAAFWLMLLPWMVVGGVLWGQLDAASLAGVLLAFIALWQAWQAAGQRRLRLAWPWLLLAGLMLALLLLLKQLNTFALPFFLFLLALVLGSFWRELGGRGLAAALAALLLAAAFFRLLDSRFALPPEAWGSTFWHGWQASPHGDVISGNGFNLWILLGRDMWSSSREPFTALRLGPWSQDLTPYHTGMALYALLLVGLFAAAFIAVRPLLARGELARLTDDRRAALLAWLALLLGLTQLGFNVLLTGTHERYLFLGYPFLILSTVWFARRGQLGMGLAAFTVVAAILNGVFVLGAMQPLPGILFVVYSNAFQASLHMILLVALLAAWLRISRQSVRDRSPGIVAGSAA
jgi:4-amino-4-deoxy-L-arabinose transferase-like glycosyltransferase